MTPITRENIDVLLDGHDLYAAMKNGRWYQCRRNGATKTWKRDPERIRVPIKVGFREYYAITETDFRSNNMTELNSGAFRAKEDLDPGTYPS